MRLSFLPVAFVILLVGCAGRRRGLDRERNIIRADEIASIQAATAYDVVAKLRRDFLRARGTVTRTRSDGRRDVVGQEQPSVTVFVDDVEAGPVERALYLIPASELFEIRLYRPADAATKYGTRHSGGVIAITTRRPQR